MASKFVEKRSIVKEQPAKAVAYYSNQAYPGIREEQNTPGFDRFLASRQVTVYSYIIKSIYLNTILLPPSPLHQGTCRQSRQYPDWSQQPRLSLFPPLEAQMLIRGLGGNASLRSAVEEAQL